MRSNYIVIEGLEGAGKTTARQLVVDAIPRAANGTLNVMVYVLLIDNYSHYIAVIWRTAMLIPNHSENSGAV